MSTMISSAVTLVIVPARRAMTTAPESRATFSSSPVPTSGVLRIEKRNGLPLHVRSHQRAVGVVVLEERNECRGDGDELLRRDIHVVDALGLRERNVTALAAEHQLVDERSVFVQLRRWPAR